MIKVLNYVWLIFLGGGLLILGLVYWPIINEEIRYQNLENQRRNELPIPKTLTPVSKEFGLVIPKLELNVKVFADVDANSPQEYLPILTKGVAHAKGSVLPNEMGNVFIFGHSSDTPLNINRYNAVFYLISKLEKNDEIIVYYNYLKYNYRVTDKKIISPDKVAETIQNLQGETLTLQTCYPPGTTLYRLLVLAKK